MRPGRLIVRPLVCWFGLVVFVFSLTGSIAWSTATTETTERIKMVIGFSQKTLANVDAKDATSALGIYAEELGRQLGYEAQSRMYEGTDGIVRDMNAGKLDIVATSILEYFQIKSRVDAELAVVHVRNGKAWCRYLILSSVDGGPSSIDELKGKRIAFRKGDDLARLYLDTVILKQHRVDAKRFAASIEEKLKASQVILSVFFKQTDACVIDDDAYKIICELNPQVGKKLKVLAASSELVNSVSFFRRGLKESVKQKTITVTNTLKDTPRGKQIFLLFKMTDVVPVSEADLEGVRKLVTEYEALKRRM